MTLEIQVKTNLIKIIFSSCSRFLIPGMLLRENLTKRRRHPRVSEGIDQSDYRNHFQDPESSNLIGQFTH